MFNSESGRLLIFNYSKSNIIYYQNCTIPAAYEDDIDSTIIQYQRKSGISAENKIIGINYYFYAL
jgi:hypothetical protein